jgi:hypothetical protein
MLEAISDFWKPMKKGSQQEKLNPDQLQQGSAIGFGFVPQASISGRRLQVIAINTYQFGEEALTSFVLGQDKDAAVSMIVAESEGEHYLAISRRITISDRMKMFDSRDLENILEKPEVTHLPCKDNISDFKGWTVPSYKREIQGMRGLIYKGDYRKASLPDATEAQAFTYTLLVSDSNEHAIEIEKYQDGRIEMYATVYRRMSDIGEITHPTRGVLDRPDIKLALDADADARLAANFTGEAPKAETKPEPLELAELAPPPAATPAAAAPAAPVAISAPIFKPQTPAAPAPELVKSAPAEKPAPVAATTIIKQEEKPTMATTETAVNGTRAGAHLPTLSSDITSKPSVVVQPTAPQSYLKQEVKTVSKQLNGMENEAIECDLRVANKIIDEAIRNEMRLSDIVRRIIELPVAYPEAVQIPITLSDEDYALLAIRYGMTPTDRNAIKRKIIEDLNDFSGGSQQKKAA